MDVNLRDGADVPPEQGVHHDRAGEEHRRDARQGGHARGVRGGIRVHRWAPRRRDEDERQVRIEGVQTHHHDGLPDDGWAYDHSHECEDCGELFRHTHMRRTYEESIALQPHHLCPACRRAPQQGQRIVAVVPPVEPPAPDPENNLTDEELEVRLRAYLQQQVWLNRRTTLLFKGLLRKGSFWLEKHGVKSEEVQMRMLSPLMQELASETPGEKGFRLLLGHDEAAYESLQTATKLAEGVVRYAKRRPWAQFTLWLLSFAATIASTIMAANLATPGANTFGVLVIGVCCMAYVARAMIAAWAWQWAEKPLPKCD